MAEDVNNSETIIRTCEYSSEYCPSCYPVFSCKYIFKLLLKFIVYIFGYSLYSRLLTLLLILQAAVLWIGYSLNFVLQLLFMPFLHFNNKSLPLVNFIFFLSCYFLLPGIISFSSHYFWFIIQFGFHCYTNDGIKLEQIYDDTVHICHCCSKRGQQIKLIEKKDDDNNDDTLLCFPQKKFTDISMKEIYRIIITLCTTSYIIFSGSEDLLTRIIISLGLIPLGLMWILHIMHLFGICFFVKKCFYAKINDMDHFKSQIDDSEMNSDIQYIQIFGLFSIVMIITSSNIMGLYVPYHIIVVLLLFSIYILLYNQTPIKIIHIDNDKICCCCYNKKLMIEKNLFYTRNLLVKLIERIIQSSLTMKKNKQLHTYKLFILIILYTMVISFHIMFTHFFSENRLFMTDIIKMILILLWLPPIFNQKTNQWIINKQMFLVQILLILMCLTSILGILVLCYFSKSNIALICLCFPFVYASILLFYYILHWRKYSSPTVALIK
ncbi:unnamed protein product, partial [Didymodactylos carnosus]